jgi:Zn-dependent protease with chaperone function
MNPTQRRRFPGLSPRAYEHPADRAALTALRAVPGFDLLVRKVLGAIGDRALRLVYLASAVRINERQLPEIHERYLEACAILDLPAPPELFLAQTPLVNAGAIGVDRPFIVLNSGSLDLFDADELQFVLGHELGHVLSGHALYKTMLHILLRASTLALSVPLGGAALFAIASALLEWDRASELSGDRAGLLVCQSPDVAVRTNMKMAGGGRRGMNVEEFVSQADEYHRNDSVADSLLKLLTLLGRTHPFPVLRVAEIRTWVKSGEYDHILGGAYSQRAEDAGASIPDSLRDATRSYQDAFAARGEPVLRLMRDAGKKARDLQSAVEAALRQMAAEDDDEAKGT